MPNKANAAGAQPAASEQTQTIDEAEKFMPTSFTSNGSIALAQRNGNPQNNPAQAIDTAIAALEWLAQQGASFALPRGRTKGQFEGGWQNNPHTLTEAQDHARRGGNVGLLVGTHSGGIIAIDIDHDYPAVVASLGPFARTAKIVRDNAPGRGKLLYRVGFSVESRGWKPDGWTPAEGEKNSPWSELLSDGRHALIPPSEFGGGRYVLVDQEHGIAELRVEELSFVWYKATVGRPGLPEPEATAPEGQATHTANGSDFDAAKAVVLDAWSTLDVFSHHGRATVVVAQRNGETRLLGNGGLLIKENGEGWYCFADGKGGGDAISAWAYCTGRGLTGKAFWDTLREMAEAKGLELPEKRQPPSDGAPSGGADVASNSGGGRKPTQAEILYGLASAYAEIFIGQDSRAYAFVPVYGRRECYRLDDDNFAGWLTDLYRSHCDGAMPGAAGRDEAIAALAWDARATRRDVFVRVGGHGGKVYIDLGTEEWDAVEVDAHGWRVVAQPPVAFRRPKSLKALPLPVDGAGLDRLRGYVNVDDDDWPLIAGWLVAAANPRGPYPVLALAGEQGTAKSTTVRVLKELIDPAAACLRGQPDEVRDLWVYANNSWVLAFDNVSRLESDVSDALCRLSTGGGYAKRANYTDDDEFVMDAQRPVILNGIGDIVTRPDLMDRAILVCPPVIPAGRRREEREFWDSFNRERPRLLGALLGAISTALGNIERVSLPAAPRMADFARLGVAAQPAMGGDVDFLDAYNANREEAHATVVETSTLGEHLRALVIVNGAWEGTATELLTTLNERASESEKRSNSWPRVANRIRGALQRLAPSLRHIGVAVEFPPRSDKGGRRLIRLVRLNE